MKVAVIGCGTVSEKHLRAYVSNDRAELVAVVDIDKGKAKARAREFNARFYTNHLELIREEEIHAASVCLPPYSNIKVIPDLSKHGIHVLCEKPLAVTVEDAERLVKQAEKTQSLLMTGFCWRFHQPLIKAKKWMEEDTIGAPVMFQFRYGRYRDMEGTWYAAKETGGGSIKSDGIHAFDLFRWLIGDAQDVSGKKAKHQNIEAEDSFSCVLRSRDGVLGVIQMSSATTFAQNFIEISGSRGSIFVDFVSRARLVTERCVETIESNEEKHSRFQNEIDHFLQCICGECKPLITGTDALESIRLADAVDKSAEDRTDTFPMDNKRGCR